MLGSRSADQSSTIEAALASLQGTVDAVADTLRNTKADAQTFDKDTGTKVGEVDASRDALTTTLDDVTP